MSDKPIAVIQAEFREALAKRGGLSIKTLAKAFHVNDRDRNGRFDFDEFETILARAGVFLKQQDLKRLFRLFDRDNSGSISYQEFLEGVQGQLSQRRTEIIRKAFEKIDRTGNGVLELDDIIGVYDASKHPQVVTGQKTEEAVLQEFLEGFKRDDADDAKGGSFGVVRWEDFLDYYRGVSASITEDVYFVTMMEKVWGVQETGWDGKVAPKEEIERLKDVLREKVRQRTKGTTEADTLRLAFKWFDIDDSGLISESEFKNALHRFGVVLDEKACHALFSAVDTSGNGLLSYAEFCKELFGMPVTGIGARSGKM